MTFEKLSVCLAILVLILSPYNSFAQNTHLIKDINPGSEGSYEYGFSSKNFIEYKDKLYFRADDGVNGAELWVYDGSEASLVIDINPGELSSEPRDFFLLKDKIFFIAEHEDYGIEMWVTDGTSSGTHLLIDLFPGTKNGAANSVDAFIIYNDELYFGGRQSQSIDGLYKTDGTKEGTVLVQENTKSYGTSDILFEFKGELYFTCAGCGLWKTDGTPHEGEAVIHPDSIEDYRFKVTHAYAAQDYIYIFFNDGKQHLWMSDGTSSGSGHLHTFSGERFIYFQSGDDFFYEFKGKVYLATTVKDKGLEYFSIEGDKVENVEMPTIYSSTAGKDEVPSFERIFKDKLFFLYDNGELDDQLYYTENSIAEAKRAVDINEYYPNSFFGAQFYSDLFVTDKYLFFVAGDFEYHFWYTDGSQAGTFKLDLENGTGTNWSQGFHVYKNKLIFFAQGSSGVEPYYIDLDEISIDLDGDGYESFEDCNDTIAEINPGATEIPNNGIDEDCDGEDAITSVIQQLDSEIEVYPNPVVDDRLYFRTTQHYTYSVKLSNTSGQILNVYSNPQSIQINHLENGIYYLDIFVKEYNASITKKILVNR